MVTRHLRLVTQAMAATAGHRAAEAEKAAEAKRVGEAERAAGLALQPACSNRWRPTTPAAEACRGRVGCQQGPSMLAVAEATPSRTMAARGTARAALLGVRVPGVMVRVHGLGPGAPGGAIARAKEALESREGWPRPRLVSHVALREAVVALWRIRLLVRRFSGAHA